MNPKVITLNSEWSVFVTYSEEADKQEIILFSIIHWEAETGKCIQLDIPLLRWNYLQIGFSSKIKKAIQQVQNRCTNVDQQFSVGGGLEVKVSSQNNYVHMCMFHRDYNLNQIIPIGPQLRIPFPVWDLIWDKVNNTLFSSEATHDYSICIASEDHANQVGFLTCSECNPYTFMDDYMDNSTDVTIPWEKVEEI